MFLQISCFYIPCFNVYSKLKTLYALHLMNVLLNIFCYIISNVSNRKNLHRVQLMTKSYPNQQRLLQKSNVSYTDKGHDTFCPINLGQSSQDSKNLSKAKIVRGVVLRL